MALQQGVGQTIAFKKYASGAVASSTSLTLPGTTGAQYLRRVSASLSPQRSAFQSEEVRSDRQISNFNLGGHRVSGQIAGELSPLTYWEFIVAAARNTATSAITDSNTEFTSVEADNATSKFTFGGGDPISEGYRVGDVIRFSNLSVAANNDVNFMITAFAGASNREVTVYPAPTTMTADTAFSVTRPGKKIVPALSSHVDSLFAFEVYGDAIDDSILYQECRVNGIEFSLPAEGIARVGVNVTGRGSTVYEDGSSPYFQSVSAATTTNALTASSGFLRDGGSINGVLEGIDLTISLAPEAPAVAFNSYTPDIALGRYDVRGQFTALMENYTQVSRFLNETEFALQFYVRAPDTSAPYNFMAFHMPRVKTTNVSPPVQGEGFQRVQVQYQALFPATATGYDQATLIIQDSAA